MSGVEGKSRRRISNPSHMSQGEQQQAQPVQQTEVAPAGPTNSLPAIGDDQWNKDITGILTSNAHNNLVGLDFNPNVLLQTLKDADNTITQLKAEKKMLEIKTRDLSAHLALANNRINFSKQDAHSMWKEVIYYREKHHVLQRQHQEVLRAHSSCATGPPERPYFHLLQELEKLQDMYRHILGQNTTLKFEVQRLMQQCVNGGLIPPPQNYVVTPLPALQPSATHPGIARRTSEPTVGHQQQLQVPVQYSQKAAQPGPVARQFVSPPSNAYATNPPVALNPAIVAGPIQAYNYHRAQFPQSQHTAAQMMPPPRQQGRSPVLQQHIPATRPRQVVDLTEDEDEPLHKRPRMASDPNVYTQHSVGSATPFQHQIHAQMPAPAPYQVLQQRILQSRSQVAPSDRLQGQIVQQYYSQRSGTGSADQYQQVSPPTASTYFTRYGTNTHPNVPTPSTSVPPVMESYGIVTGEQGTTQTQNQPPNGQMQAFGQPRQVYTDPAYSVDFTSSAAGAGTSHTGSPNERSAGNSTARLTPAVAPSDSVPLSPRAATNGHMHGREPSLPMLTDEQASQMHSDVADSMFTEPNEGDETQARTCMLCDHRRRLGILPASPPPFFKPTTGEMYSHLQAQHSESLDMGEQDWKRDLFGMGPISD